MKLARVTLLMACLAALASCGGGSASAGADASPTPAPAPSSGAAPVPASPPAAAGSRIYHVRQDGGTAAQCTGLADAPYGGTGASSACAWNSPMIALPPVGAARIAGGDTLIIHAGPYRIGFGAPGSEACSADYPWDCAMAALPSGPDADHPTRVLGEGHDSGCSAPPQLWGTQRVRQVISLAGTRHAELACLEITDHSSCVEFHASVSQRCPRDSYPYGDWAPVGLTASDSSDVKVSHLNIHGMASRGVLAGRLADWEVTDLRIAGNGWAGWDGDLGSGVDSSNSGLLRFTRWLVEWNGCAETWPGNQPTACWGQSAGGYGDGVGTAATAGDWVIEESTFRHNTSDGLDLLYHQRGGSVTLNRVWAEANAGNQIKLAGSSRVSNSVVIGTCGSFHGAVFTHDVDDCRALGDALAVFPVASTDVVVLANNTIASEGNVAVLASGPAGATVRMRNNLLVGLPYFLDPGQQSADTYDDSGHLQIDEAYSLKQGLRNARCAGPGVLCGQAGLLNATRSGFDPRLQAGSAARDSGLAAGGDVPATDYFGTARPQGGGVDRGALEMQP